MPREEVAKNQRERLFAAMVAAVAAKGYEDTTVADVLERSGVSRSAFYEHFRDKEECFLATFEGISEQAMTLIREELERDGNGSEEARLRRAVQRTLETIAEEPAVARLCFDGIYTAGAPGRMALEKVMGEFEALTGETVADVIGDELPKEIIWGLLGGTQAVIQIHLGREEDGRLVGVGDDLLSWALSYRSPPVKLRLAGRRPRPENGHPPPFVAYSQAERIIRALAACAKERGYPAVTIAEIAARASISQATFYSHFDDKGHALLAALDSAAAQMFGVVMPAARRAPDWPNSVRAAIGAFCAFGAAEPDLACLAAVESYAAGSLIADQRNRSLDTIRSLLTPGYELAPRTKPLVADAVIGAVWGLVYNKICKDGPRSLPEIAPLASYMALSPFIGAEQAAAVANGDGRGVAQS